jgi:hypothetical protein
MRPILLTIYVQFCISTQSCLRSYTRMDWRPYTTKGELVLQASGAEMVCYGVESGWCCVKTVVAGWESVASASVVSGMDMRYDA